MTVSQNNFNCAQKLPIIDMTRSVSCFVCIEIIDSALLASSSDVSEIEEILKRELESVSEWLAENRLSLHHTLAKLNQFFLAQTSDWLSVKN